MPERLEADLVLLNVSAGRPAPADPPGLASFAPPRRTARGRERDLLFLCLGLRLRPPTPAAEQLTPLLQLAAATFYGTPGSVTAAARQAVLAVNQKLLDGNLREGAPVQGGLLCVVLRGTGLYAVLSGPGTLVVTHAASIERFPAAASRPIGLSDVLDALYFHTEVAPGDYVALSQTARWAEADLAGLGGLTHLSAVSERLKAAAGGDFTALVARLEPEGLGNTAAVAPAAPVVPAAAPAPRPSLAAVTAGLTERLRGGTPPAPVEPPAAPEPDPAPRPVVETQSPPATEPEPAPARTDWRDLLRRTERWRSDEVPPAAPEPAPQPEPVPQPEPAAAPEPTPFKREPRAGREARRAAAFSQVSASLQNGLRAFGRAVGVTLTEAVRSLRRLLARAMPEGTLQRDGLLVVPTPVQIGIAVVLPLLIVAIVALVYIQRGQEEQFSEALQQVQTEVTKGRLAADPVAARPNWEAAVAAAARADKLRPDNPQIAQLRQEAQTKLDELDWVTRVDYVPLIPGGLGANTQLDQILLVGRDVYALDAAQKRVLRLTPNPSGVYVRDDTFQCASGPLGPLTIGPLVDLGFVPGPNVRDTDAIVALDNAGALLYCAPGAPPLGSYLPAPDTGWVQPMALELLGDRLYVLDAGVNQVWQFQATGGVFNQAPAGFFSSVVYDLKNVVDFTIAGGDLALLRKDGRVLICARTQPLGEGTCTDNAAFTDGRPGRGGGDQLADLTAPRRLMYDQPPEPALFVVNPANAGLFQVSLKLVFTRQFQPTQPLDGPVTAMAIDPAKRFFVATRSNIYVGSRP